MRYLSLLNSHLTKPSVVDLNRDILAVYPSSASARYVDKAGFEVTAGACLRQEWYRRRDMKHAQDTGQVLLALNEDPNLVWMARAGNAAEDAEVQTLQEMGLLLHSQYAGKLPELNISFRVDAIIVDPDTAKPGSRGTQIGIEVKSKSGHGAGRVIPGHPQAVKYRPAEPEHKNLLQTGFYDWYFRTKKPAGLDISYFLLVYRDRATGYGAQYQVVYDTESDRISVDGQLSPFYVGDILARFKTLQEHVKTGTMPPRDYQLQYSQERCETLAEEPGILTMTQCRAIKKGEWEGVGDVECRRCPWAAECWNLNAPTSASPVVYKGDDF